MPGTVRFYFDDTMLKDDGWIVERDMLNSLTYVEPMIMPNKLPDPVKCKDHEGVRVRTWQPIKDRDYNVFFTHIGFQQYGILGNPVGEDVKQDMVRLVRGVIGEHYDDAPWEIREALADEGTFERWHFLTAASHVLTYSLYLSGLTATFAMLDELDAFGNWPCTFKIVNACLRARRPLPSQQTLFNHRHYVVGE